MKTDQEYDEIAKSAAVRIARILNEFRDEPEHVRAQLMAIVQARTNRILNGDPLIIDGDGLVTVIPDPEETAPEEGDKI